MLKHIEDDGGLDIFINDRGEMLVSCRNGHNWVGQLTPVPEAEAASMEGLVRSIKENPEVFADSAIDPDALRG